MDFSNQPQKRYCEVYTIWKSKIHHNNGTKKKRKYTAIKFLHFMGNSIKSTSYLNLLLFHFLIQILMNPISVST